MALASNIRRALLLEPISRGHAAVVLRRRVRRLADHISGLIPTGASVLDIGCGDGRLAAEIHARRPDIRVCGVDVLIRPGAAIPVARFDGVTVPVRDAGVDVALIVDVLHHTDDAATLLREAARVSRRAVIIKDHIADRRRARLLLRVMDWVGNAPHGVALPYNYLSRRQWRDAFLQAGLQLDMWQEELKLYPQPFSIVLDDDLHFIARLEPAGSR